jgi:hypothetical protein
MNVKIKPIRLLPRNNKQANIMPMAEIGDFGIKEGIF